MPDPIQVEVTRNSVLVVEPDQTIISSLELVNALVVDPAEAWQSVAATFQTIVSTDMVRVTEGGRIVIRDAGFCLFDEDGTLFGGTNETATATGYS